MMILWKPVTEVVIWIMMCFGVFIPAAMLVQSWAGEKTRVLLKELCDSAIVLIRWSGVIYFFLWLAGLYAASQDPEEWLSLNNRMSGPYAAGYWIYLIAYIVVPQFFWIERVRESGAARLISALFILFVINLERIVILITSLHRDYVPSGWVMYSVYPVFAGVINGLKIAGFVGLLFIIRFYRKSLRV